MIDVVTLLTARLAFVKGKVHFSAILTDLLWYKEIRHNQMLTWLIRHQQEYVGGSKEPDRLILLVYLTKKEKKYTKTLLIEQRRKWGADLLDATT
jgi:hypothetical protein